jgi:hypothetical protein
VKGFGHFVPDNALSQEEISIIAAWVIGGAPQGDPALLPKPMSAQSLNAAAPLTSVLTVQTKTKLASPLLLAGLAPLPESAVTDVRITATLPDGEIQPVVWLHEYQPKWKTTFRLESALHLPAGTVIEASSPLKFGLKTVSLK